MLRVCPKCNHVDDGDETFIDSSTCPQCGQSAVADRAFAVAEVASPADAKPAVGKFRLLETVGHGAYGTVWKAEDVELGRTVAVKLLHSSLLARRADAERFYREARAAAQLRHPGIVAVHEVLEIDGVPAIVSEFIDGQNLRQIMAGGGLNVQEVACLVAQVADALDYAHKLNIIHRDVTPGNIMVAVPSGERLSLLKGRSEIPCATGRHDSTAASSPTPSPRALLLDFGLALRKEAEATLTTDGQVLGTPSYMSPEQAAGDSHRVDRRTDVYSLGAVLYELLTGQVPFKGPSVVVLRKVIGEEPPRPRELAQEIPRDLETICLKAMGKSRTTRYSTAGAFADDLRCFLAGRSISARPDGILAKLWSFGRRNPSAAVAILAISAVLLISSIVSTLFAFKAIEARRNVEHTLMDSYVSNGIQAAELGRPAESLIWFAAAHDRVSTDQAAQQENASRFWSYARSMPRPTSAIASTAHAKSAIVHPTGQFAIVRDFEDKLSLLDLRAETMSTFPHGEMTCPTADWNAAGDQLALSTPTGVALFDFPSGRNRFDLPSTASVTGLKFDPTGRYLAIANHELKIWDCHDRRYAGTPLPLRLPAQELAFSANGRYLAAASGHEYCRVWSLDNRDELKLVYSPASDAGIEHPLVNVRQKVPLFVNNDRYLVVSPNDTTLELIDTTTWMPDRSIAHPTKPLAINWICTNLSRSMIAVGFYNQVLLYDIDAHSLLGESLVHSNTVLPGGFSTDGKTFITACGDRTSRLWSVPSGKPAAPQLLHQDSVSLAMFLPGDRSFLTIQSDGLTRCWRQGATCRELPLGGRDSYLAMSPDGQHCLGAGVNLTQDLKEPQLHHLSALASITTVPLNIDRAQLYNATFSPDNQHVVLLTAFPAVPLGDEPPAETRGRVLQFDVVDGNQRQPSLTTPTIPIGAAYSSDGSVLVVVCAGGEILVIDCDEWQVKQQLFSEPGFNSRFGLRDFVRFFPTGSRFVTWGIGFKARVWDAASGNLQYVLDAKTAWIADVQFSHGGTMLATASYDKTATVYDASTGALLAPPLVHPDWVLTARFSPNDQDLLTACRDGKGRRVSWRTGELACATLNHNDELIDVAFAKSGTLIVTACRDGSARVWNARNGKPISPPLRTDGYCYRARITPDDSLLVLSSASDKLQVYSLPDLVEPDESTHDRLMETAEILSGSTLHANGGTENLTTGEWLARWKLR